MAYFHGLLSQPDCHNCPLQYDPKVYPDGEVPAKIAVVAESPGATEIQQGRGLVGPSGKLFWILANAAGIKREEIWTSNGSLCKPRSVKLTNGATIGKNQVLSLAARACRLRLIEELRIVNPTVIIPVGGWSLWAIADIPKAKIYDYRGSRMEVDLARMAELIRMGAARAPTRTVAGQAD